MGLMLAWNDDFRSVFWVAVIPGVLCFLLIIFGLQEPESKAKPNERRTSRSSRTLRIYWEGPVRRPLRRVPCDAPSIALR